MMESKVIGVVVCLLVTTVLTNSSTAKRPFQPNILFILVDDLGYNDIGYHAENFNSEMKTPFLDAMAAQGIKLENYYVQPRCTPTRSQLLTGRYDIHTGLHHAVIYSGQPNAIPLEFKLLPDQLEGCGYDTHMVGKWHLGFYRDEVLPWNRGFGTFFGVLGGGGDQFTREACNKGVCGVDMWSSVEGPVNNTWGEYSAHLYARKAMEAIDHRDASKPFFLYLSYQSVHYPIQAPDEYVNRFSHIRDKKRRIYAGMVAAMDESIQNVTSHLWRKGILDDTIIIFSTDNGGIPRQGGNNYPYRGGKATLWEGGTKAVGFVYGKPLGMHGITHNGMLHVSDWFPTILRVASCPSTVPLDGYDQWDAIRQRELSARTEILHGFDPKLTLPRRPSNKYLSTFDTAVRAAIRVGPWKLITGNPGDPTRYQPPEYVQQFSVGKRQKSGKRDKSSLPQIQLFHIDTDPHELTELSSKYPEVVDRLLLRLEAHNATAVPVRFPPYQRQSSPLFHEGYWKPWIK